ncbi:MAG: VWA domain-containing protein [Acidobacteriota bacterium]
MKKAYSILLILLAGLTVNAQQVGQNNQGGQATPTFQVSSQLVIETITVTAKGGAAVEGLKAEDFSITEDGIPQVISVFEHQRFDDAAVSPPAPLTARVIPLEKYPQAQIGPETAGKVRYHDRRLLVLYFDMSAMPLQDQLRSFDAAEKFVRTQMTESDLMAVMIYDGGSIRVLQDFTDDRERVLTIVETLSVGKGQLSGDTLVDFSDSGTAFGQDDSEFNIFNTDRQLSALQTAAMMLGSLSEKKALVYFSSGLRLNGVDNQAQLRATINAAIRSGVSFWPIDARGLMAQAPLGDATRSSMGGAGMYTGASAMALMGNLQRSQDTLWSLASDTGGKALLDYNDLSRGITQAQRSISSYYIIGYYTTNQNLDGKFRRIKVSLNGELSGNLNYRQGYYARKQFGKFTVAEKERQLEDALMLEDPVTDLTIAMEVDYFQLNRADYFVPLVVKIPGSELVLAKRGGAEHTLLDFMGEIKDESGVTVSNVRDKVDIKLSDATAAELLKRPIQYDTGFTLLPGKYRLKFLARDAETGRIGTYEMSFVIPNLNKEDKRIPISSVVLSSQRVDLRDALFNASKDKGQAEAVNPLVQEGQKLIPSVTRVFSKSRDMYVYFQAYQQGVESARPLVAFVTFYSGRVKAFETPPLLVTEALNNRLKTTPLKFSLSLNNLLPGRYNCQVTITDPEGQKAAFWQAPVVLIP